MSKQIFARLGFTRKLCWFLLGIVMLAGLCRYGLRAARAEDGAARQGARSLFARAVEMVRAPKIIAAAPMAILTVTSTGDGAANVANCPGANCRLRDAIAAASSGDTITFSIPTSDAGYDSVSGVYSIALATVGDNTFGPSALLINKALTIDAGSSQITITRAGSAGTLRPFYVTSAGSLTLKGVRLTDGNAFEGGAIYNQGNVVATGATFHLNNSINRGRGGAIFNTGTGLFTATRTSFQSNQAEGVGGAIYNDSTNATPVSITESDFLNNYSIGYVLGGNTFRSDGHGGAIYNAGRLSVGRSDFGGNQSNYNGGAIYNVSSGRLTVSDSFFELNGPTSFSIGPFYGGAIRNDGMLLVSGTTFYTNSANNRGGAVFASGTGSQTTLVNSTFSRNSANYGAAVIGSGSVTVGVYNCTLAENTGFNAVYSELGASVTVANSIVFNTGTQIEFNSFNGSFNLANNIVRGSNPNPQLLALGPHGGPQIGLTGFQNFMYGIPATSPAVDAGDNARIPIDPATNLPFATDQRGVARVQRGNTAAPAAVVDIGAFEIPFVCPAITVTNPAATTGTVGAAFSQSFTQTGGGTVGFSTGSTLPPGLSLNSNGTLSGTPTQAGTFPIVVTATDDNNCMGTGTTYNLVIGCPAITVGTPGAGATIHQSYSSSVAASPAAPAGFNYQYALANNTTLPPGLMLNATTGEITGAPTALGQVNFTVKAELFSGVTTTGCAATQNFSINVTCAANPVVTTNADSGAGSLRQAILDACPGSTITFANGINLITLTSGELVINKNLTIQGPGASVLTISGNLANRVCQITSGVTATLEGLTIANGHVTGYGGGIYSDGTLTLISSTVSGNTASGVLDNLGGGIYNASGRTLKLINSTISGNEVSCSGTRSCYGGGLANYGTLTLTNSTVSGNSATGGNNQGGGIFNADFGGTLTLTNSTVSGNSATGGNNRGGGLFNDGGTVQTKNAIIAGNSASNGPDANGGVTSQGYNLIGDNQTTTITPMTGDQIGTHTNPLDPKLGPLANNGGPTQTHALLPGSPAINAGDNCVLTANGCGNNNPALTTDQRGADFPRQSGSAVDIGAFEAFVCPTITVTNPGISNGTVGAAFSQSFTQTGGGTVSFSTGSALPPGLSLNSNGTLSGTPTQAGTFPIIVTATESGSNCAGTGTAYTLVIGCPTITVGTPTGSGAPGAAYSSSVAATPAVNSPMNYQYSLANGTTLPPGLSLNAATGAITGTPTAAGNVSFDIKAELFNSNTTTGCSVTATRSINITCPATATLYVNAAVAGGLGDGSSWANALPTLSAALARAGGCSNVTQIWVAQGTYKPTSGTDRNATFTLRNNLAIYGGFTSGQTLLNQRNPNPATNNTILSGDIGTANDASDNSFHVVTGGDGTDSSAVLDGFTISGGRTNNVGAGMYNDNSSPTLTNLTFSGNYALQGGGMWNRRGSPTLTNVTFSGNASDNGGGGMVNSIFSNPTLTNVTFIGNYTVQGGGGMYNKDNSSPTLTNVSFSGNFATFGGGIYNLSSNPQIRNSILWGDSGGEISNNNNSNPVVSDSLVQGGYSGTGNLSSDPLFVSSSNLRLLPASPAINAGNNSVANPALPATDLTGNPRIAGGAVDMGAYEANYALALTAGNNQSAALGAAFAGALQATLTEYGQPISGVTINFTAPVSGASATLSSPTATTNSGGQASVTATANNISGGPYNVTASANSLTTVSFSLTNTCPTITVGTPTATGALGTAYSSSVAATPAAPQGLSYKYSLANGTSLPAGLSLDTTTGAITGTPTAPGQVNFTIKVELFSGATTIGCAATQNFSINVTCTNNPQVTTNADSGAGSLREAIALACPGSTITFANGISLITLTSGELAINKNLTISGAGANLLSISGNNASRVFNIAAGATVVINYLTVRGGNADNGGGILNFGTLNLNGVVVTGNTASAVNGGIGNFGPLILTHSTVSNNICLGGTGSGGIGAAADMLIVNSTISGNTIPNAFNNAGGGIWSNANLTVINSTITDNQGVDNGGIRNAGSATFALRNVIVAGNRNNQTAPDVVGAFNSINSLVGNVGAATGFVGNGNQTGTSAAPLNAKLAPLGNYGGPTQTHALLPGSPAINAGDNCVLTANGCGNNNPALTADQRGIARVGAVDIGAFESRGFTLATNGGGNQGAITNTTFANPLSVTVTSAFGEPVDGGQVVFTPPGSGASATIAGNPATITGGTATTGTVTANAIAGSYTVVASAQGAVAGVNFSLTNIPLNTAPSFTPVANLSRQQGSAAGAAVPIGTVNDAQTDAGLLTVTEVSGGTATGVTVSNITNKGGTISAQISASCVAAGGTVRFQVSDGSLTSTGDLTITVTANSTPTISYGNAMASVRASTSNSPTVATDNGSITGYSVQSAGTFTGTISVNASGLVSISNARPVGTHTITIRATDNCNATKDASFTLTVTNTAPSITVQSGITRQQGAPVSNSQIATVNDAESGADGVTVTVNGGSSATVNGVTVSNIANSGGTITADIVATCGATNASFTLTANDGDGGTATATLLVDVTGIVVTPTTLINGLTLVGYNAALSAAGGSGSYNFSLASGHLPDGLTLNGNLITGTPTTAGAFTFTIRANDDGNTCFGERSYTLVIGSTGLMYYPLPRPVRLLDTRPGASPNACNQPNAQIPANTSLTLMGRRTCDGIAIPANATTLTGNVTVVQPTGNGFLTLYPGDIPQPQVTSSNFLAGEVLNNAFTVRLGAQDGAFKVFVNSTTHVVIDVTGYYAPPSVGGLYFYALPKPIRLLETRQGFTGCQTTGAPLQAGSTRVQTGLLSCNGVTIPIGAQALVGNATTTNSQNNGYLTLYPAGAAQPFIASSNYVAGINRNAPFTVGLSLNGEFSIYTAQTTDLVIDVVGYYSTETNDLNGQGLLFNALGSPLRLLDTRAGQTACYTPGAPMMGGTAYTQETQIPCSNLTSAARALAGNVSAVNATANGYLTFWPSNAAQPTVATSNYQTGRVFNRHFTVGLGADAAFRRFTSSTTDLIIDISGFFAP